jgi:hypothetical protein
VRASFWEGGHGRTGITPRPKPPRVTDPSDDEEAIRMLAGHPNSATFVSEYAELRCSDTPIERALVSVGHAERLRQHAYMPVRLAERDRPGRKTRPSATGYELLLAVRLREESKDRRRGRRS